MNVLVIAPHPDDESIGCGGTICRHVKRGNGVHVVFLTSGELGLKTLPREKAWAIREQEARDAAKVLRLQTTDFLRLPDWMMGDDPGAATRAVQPVIQRLQPELILLPHPGEWHPDHKACLPIVRGALHDSATQPRLLGYEVWTPLAEYQHVENITDVMRSKLKALRKHQSQVSEWDYVRAVRCLNGFRGVMAGRCQYAEVFQELAMHE
jgi:LmbE family N-acetylglucosaminyl deacetylase